MSQQRLNVLVVDDEAPARDELAFLLRQQEAVGRVAMAAGAAGGGGLLSPGGLAAVFLHVRMPPLGGVALARMIWGMVRPPLVVFVTAYEDHAVEAFGLAALDYLMKPVRPERLGVTIGRLVRAQAPAEVQTGPPALDDRIAVSARGQIRLIPISDVRVVVADGEGASVLS